MSKSVELTQAIGYLIAAGRCIEADDKVGKGENLTLAFDIIAGLRKSLSADLGDDLIDQIGKAYAFVCHQITLANVMNSVRHVDNAKIVLENFNKLSFNNKDQQ